MTTYLSNRNSDGKTDENGHFRLPLKMIEGQIFSGFALQAQSTPNMTIKITKGEAKVPYQDYAYAVWSDADTNLTISTSSSVNDRIDRIIAYVDRGMTFTSTSTNNPGCLKFKDVVGSTSAAPQPQTDSQVQTSVGAGNPWIELGRVYVKKNSTQIINDNITKDGRVETTLSDNVKTQKITTIDNSNLKFAIINEGEDLPAPLADSVLVVLVCKK